MNPVKPNDFLTEKGILPGLTALPAWEIGAARRRVPRVRARRARDLLAVSRGRAAELERRAAEARRARPARHPAVEPRAGDGQPHRRAAHQHRQDAPERPAPVVPRHQRAARRLPLVGLHRLPHRLRATTATRSTPVRTRSYGSAGETATSDPTIPRNESGHPIRHEFTRAIPSSQCMVCHMHQPNVFVNSFYGTTMWDYEAGRALHVAAEAEISERRGGAQDPRPQPRGGGDPRQLGRSGVPEGRVEAQSAAQGHAVRRLPRPRLEFPRGVQARPQGTLLDAEGKPVAGRRSEEIRQGACTSPRSTSTSACTASTATSRRTRTATATSTARSPRRSRSTAPTATAPRTSIRRCAPRGRRRGPGGLDLSLLRTQDGRRRFEWRKGKLYQRSALDPEREWEMTLVKDTVTPGNPKYNAKAARAKLMHSGERGPRRASGARARRATRTATTRWPATPATCRGPRAAAAATCRSRPTGRPSATTTRAARRATTRPTTRRSRATTCSSSAGTAR